MQNVRYKEPVYSYCQNHAQTGVTLPFRRKNPTNKGRKKISSVALFVSVLFWGTAVGFSTEINKNNFLEPVYLNRITNGNLNFEAHQILSLTQNYATNLNFMGENLLAGVGESHRGKLIPINSAGEISNLKSKIEQVLSEYKHLNAGVFVYDYSTSKSVEINADKIFPSASIIKIPVLLDLFNKSKLLEKQGLPPVDINKKLTFTEAHRTEGSGDLQYKPADVDYSIDYLAKIMIRKSDNSATNMLIEENGGINELNSSLRHWGFSKTQVTNFLPDLKGENTTTPKDIATMLYNLDNRRFLTDESSAAVKEYMSKVENQTLIRSQVPKEAVLIHKTGDIGTMLGDAGIIYTPEGKKFILAIMVKRPHNDYSARDLIQKVSKITYDTLK